MFQWQAAQHAFDRRSFRSAIRLIETATSRNWLELAMFPIRDLVPHLAEFIPPAGETAAARCDKECVARVAMRLGRPEENGRTERLFARVLSPDR